MLDSLIERFAISIIVVAVLAPAVAYPVLRAARARSVPRLPLLLCVWAWIAVLSVTVVPDAYNDSPPTGGCFVDRTPLEVLAHPEAQLNTLLFVPIGLLTVLVLRRPLAVFSTAFLASGAIEIVQLTFDTGRQCDTLDLYSNTAGAAVGIGLGCVLLGVLKWRPQAVSPGEVWWSVSAFALGLAFFALVFVSEHPGWSSDCAAEYTGARPPKDCF